MRLLLDTHAALWWFNADRRLSAAARAAIGDSRNERLLSVAAGWEMAIKCSLRKLRLPIPVSPFLTEHMALNHMSLLGITIDDLGRIERLALHHRDPFDRIMAVQALERGLTIVSRDRIFEKYGVERIW